MYDEMYVRFSAEEYSAETTTNRYAHLTNNAITRSCPWESGTIKGNMWSQAEFIDYITHKFERDVWLSDIKPKIQQMVVWSLTAVQTHPKDRQNSFEVFGYDVMIDEELRPWLIEVNSSPSMDYSTVMLAERDWVGGDHAAREDDAGGLHEGRARSGRRHWALQNDIQRGSQEAGTAGDVAYRSC